MVSITLIRSTTIGTQYLFICFMFFHLTFSIVLHIQISSAQRRRVSSFFVDHVSQRYNATDPTRALTILFFIVKLIVRLKSSCRLRYASLIHYPLLSLSGLSPPSRFFSPQLKRDEVESPIEIMLPKTSNTIISHTIM